jgi:hypothetical protein
MTPKLQMNSKFLKITKFPKKPKLQMNHHQISKETQITIETQI